MHELSRVDSVVDACWRSSGLSILASPRNVKSDLEEIN